MINAAVIENGVVVNVIYIDADNMGLFQSRGMQLADISLLGLMIGDTTPNGVTFFRDGVPLLPPEPEPENEMADMREALEILGVTPEEG